MTLATTLERITQLQALVDPAAAQRAAAARAAATAPAVAPSPSTGGATTGQAAGGTTFAQALRGASGTTAAGGTPAIVQAAQSQDGVAEQPPGSNDSPQIAKYREAVAGSPGPGPWCAYFVSWAAKQTGAPLGENGQGFASVDAMWAWAQRSGRGVPNGAGVTPKPGDVIILNQHTGLVTGVRPDGTVETIEGNTSDRVAARTHPAGEAIGYIRTG